MAKISVIVPVYKVEQYLNRCVDSLLCQSFSDFELILVDDGSPDACPAICDSYAEKDARVHVIHQANGGLSAARNAGIEWSLRKSDSEWISFVDSDDWVHERYLESLFSAIRETGAEVACTRYYSTDHACPTIRSDEMSPILMDMQDFYCENYKLFIIAWGKLYQKSDFQTLRFPVGKLHEDEFTTWKILFRYPKIAMISAPLYAYYTNPSGIMNSNWTLARTDGLIAQEERFAELKNCRELSRAREKTAQIIAYTMAGYLEIIERNPQKDFRSYARKTRRRLRWFLLKHRKIVPYRGFGWAYGKAFPILKKPMLFWAELKDKIASRWLRRYKKR